MMFPKTSWSKWRWCRLFANIYPQSVQIYASPAIIQATHMSEISIALSRIYNYLKLSHARNIAWLIYAE